MIAFVIALVFAYLIGSIPFGIIVSRLFYGTDIRETGSGNIGAANALRSLGAKGGAVVLVLDALKGFLPAIYGVTMLSDIPAAAPAMAFATVLGHCYSPWLGFKGGKGVATALGGIFALSWPAGLIYLVIWLATFRASRFASLASLTASVLAPVALYLTAHRPGLQADDATFGVAAAAVIVLKHRANIQRLRAGTESKLSLKRNA